jgi:hypothetical protein
VFVESLQNARNFVLKLDVFHQQHQINLLACCDLVP